MQGKIFTVLLISGILILIYITTPSGYERELERRKAMEKIYSDTIDSLRLQYRLTVERNEYLTAKYTKDSLNLVEAKRTAETWRKKYNHEKNNNRHFTSATIDSLLAEIK